jgi:hypothetical protein
MGTDHREGAGPGRAAAWWRAALDWVVVDDDVRWYEIRPARDRISGLLFSPVTDPKTGKNRLHLDFRPDDQAAEVERLVALGATGADIGPGDVPWVVPADPERNEFCILSARTAGPAGS